MVWEFLGITATEAASSSTSIIDTALYFFLIVFVLAIIGIILFMINMLRKFKHVVYLKDITNNNRILEADKARELEHRDGSPVWQCLKNRNIEFTIPPSEAIEINKRGQKCVTVYMAEGVVIGFGKDSTQVKRPPEELFEVDFESIPEEITNIVNTQKREKAILTWERQQQQLNVSQWAKANNILSASQPFTSNQRTIYMAQRKRIMDRRKKSIWEYALPIAYISSMTIILLSLLIFWGDIAQPAIESKKVTESTISTMLKVVETQKEMDLNIQVLSDNVEQIKKNNGAPQ